jgi:hypothetical protein
MIVLKKKKFKLQLKLLLGDVGAIEGKTNLLKEQ